MIPNKHGGKIYGGVSALSGEVYPVRLAGVDLPADSFVSVRAKKNIVVTDIPGAVGTVKELTNIPDFEVSISGQLVARDFTTLLGLADKLLYIWSQDEAVEVLCPYTDKFGIQKISLQGFEPSMKKGMQSVLFFSFEGLSDNAFSRSKQVKLGAIDKMRKLMNTST